MKNTLRLIKWVLKAAIFFTLFAFALNNQHDASLHLFFGRQWRSPMVLIVLAAFAVGLAVGVMGMAPWRWKRGDALDDRPAPRPGTPAQETTGMPGPSHGL